MIKVVMGGHEQKVQAHRHQSPARAPKSSHVTLPATKSWFQRGSWSRIQTKSRLTTATTGTMALQEVILSACSLDSTPGAGPSRPNANLTPAIQIHDLVSSTPLQSYKTSTSALHSLGYVASSNGCGGSVMAIQEGKALLHIWAWQKVNRTSYK